MNKEQAKKIMNAVRRGTCMGITETTIQLLYSSVYWMVEEAIALKDLGFTVECNNKMLTITYDTNC